MSIVPEHEPSSNGQALPLAAGHLAKCRASGLSDETIRANKIHTVADPDQINRILGWKRGGEKLGPCLRFRFSDDYSRLRPSTPRTDKKENRAIKYESPKGKPNRAYIPHGIDAALADPTVPLAVTEGELKALCLTQNGIPTIGLTGVCGWQVKRERDAEGKPTGERRLIPDLEAIKWEGRLTFIVFDSDAAENQNVQYAERHLAEALTAKGATVRVVRIPPGPAGEKMGADDFVVARGADAMRQLLLKAEGAAAAAKPKRESAATQLVNEAKRNVTLFHDAANKTYVSFAAHEHTETHPIRSEACRMYLRRLFYSKQKKTPNTQAIQEAIGLLEALATFEGPEVEVFTRIGEHDGKLIIDLCDPEWRCVVIDANGWRVEAEAPVKFRRARGMTALPVPARGGNIEELRPFLNVPPANVNNHPFCLLVGWIIGSYMPRGPYFVLELSGQQGSGKSTVAKAIRLLIDPSAIPLRSQPRDERDAIIAAVNSHVIAYDNVSHIEAWQSDAYCRIATRSGFGTRTLYSDDEETLFAAAKPILLNGIGENVIRPDLMERSIQVSLRPIDEASRRTEKDYWQAFNAAHPRMLGAIFDALSAAVRNLPTTRIDDLPRMADAALWITAAEEGLGWAPGTFLQAYTQAADDANELSLEASPIVPPLRQLLSQEGRFSGTCSELRDALAKLAGDAAKNRGFPATARALSGQLDRLTPNLKKAGIAVERYRDYAARGKRVVTITLLEDTPGTPSHPSRPSRTSKNAADSANPRDASATVDPSGATVGNPEKDGRDERDGRRPYFSNREPGDDWGEV